MDGKRIFGEALPHLLLQGEYGYYEGILYARCPNGLLANLAKHNVVEHPDGTVTVTPSIKCEDGIQTWHGYLTSGIWKEA